MFGRDDVDDEQNLDEHDPEQRVEEAALLGRHPPAARHPAGHVTAAGAARRPRCKRFPVRSVGPSQPLTKLSLPAPLENCKGRSRNKGRAIFGF